MRGAESAPELVACDALLTLVSARLAAVYAQNRACHGFPLFRFCFPSPGSTAV